jgi:hypothetical protein
MPTVRVERCYLDENENEVSERETEGRELTASDLKDVWEKSKLLIL